MNTPSCPRSDKVKYPNYQTASEAKIKLIEREQVKANVYLCGDHWHVGKKSPGGKNRKSYRERKKRWRRNKRKARNGEM